MRLLLPVARFEDLAQSVGYPMVNLCDSLMRSGCLHSLAALRLDFHLRHYLRTASASERSRKASSTGLIEPLENPKSQNKQLQHQGKNQYEEDKTNPEHGHSPVDHVGSAPTTSTEFPKRPTFPHGEAGGRFPLGTGPRLSQRLWAGAQQDALAGSA